MESKPYPRSHYCHNRYCVCLIYRLSFHLSRFIYRFMVVSVYQTRKLFLVALAVQIFSVRRSYPVFFTIFFFHFWIASRYLGLNPQGEVLSNFDKNVKFQKFSEKFLYYSAKICTPVALILAIFIAVPFYDQWETTLLYFFGGRSGVTESLCGNDISFYLLSLPI